MAVTGISLMDPGITSSLVLPWDLTMVSLPSFSSTVIFNPVWAEREKQREKNMSPAAGILPINNSDYSKFIIGGK
jgi:hypothetical protein